MADINGRYLWLMWAACGYQWQTEVEELLLCIYVLTSRSAAQVQSSNMASVHVEIEADTDCRCRRLHWWTEYPRCIVGFSGGTRLDVDIVAVGRLRCVVGICRRRRSAGQVARIQSNHITVLHSTHPVLSGMTLWGPLVFSSQSHQLDLERSYTCQSRNHRNLEREDDSET